MSSFEDGSFHFDVSDHIKAATFRREGRVPFTILDDEMANTAARRAPPSATASAPVGGGAGEGDAPEALQDEQIEGEADMREHLSAEDAAVVLSSASSIGSESSSDNDDGRAQPSRAWEGSVPTPQRQHGPLGTAREALLHTPRATWPSPHSWSDIEPSSIDATLPWPFDTMPSGLRPASAHPM